MRLSCLIQSEDHEMSQLIAELSREAISIQCGKLELLHQVYLSSRSNEKLIACFDEICSLAVAERRKDISTTLCLNVLKLAITNEDQDLITAMKACPNLFDDIQSLLEFNFIQELKKVVEDTHQEYCNSSRHQFAWGLFSKNGFMGRFRNHIELTGFGDKNGANPANSEKDYAIVKGVVGGATEIFTIRLRTYLEKGSGNYFRHSYKTMLMKNIVDHFSMGTEIDLEDSSKSLASFLGDFDRLVGFVSKLNENTDSTIITRAMQASCMSERCRKS